MDRHQGGQTGQKRRQEAYFESLKMQFQYSIAILTVSRPKHAQVLHNILQTVSNLENASPVHVFWGGRFSTNSSEHAVLSEVSSAYSWVHVHHLPGKIYSMVLRRRRLIRSLNPGHTYGPNQHANFLHALWHCYRDGARNGSIVLEDDVVLSQSFQTLFEKILHHLSLSAPAIVSLYTPHKPEHEKSVDSHGVIRVYPPVKFFGNQALYFTPPALRLATKFFYENTHTRMFRGLADFVIKAMGRSDCFYERIYNASMEPWGCKEKLFPLPIYMPVVSLAQHDRWPSGMKTAHHKANVFYDDLSTSRKEGVLAKLSQSD